MLICDTMAMAKRSNQIVLILLLVLGLVTIFDMDISSPSSEKVESSIEDLPQLYKDRQKHIADTCEKYHDRLEEDYKKFQPSKDYHTVVTKVDVLYSHNKNPFLWCRVPKASSQSWNDLFISVWYKQSMQYTPGKQQMILRRAWTLKRKTTEFLYGSNDRLFSFMVARHPFERILSAYRDKFFVNFDYSKDAFERKKVQRFLELYGKDILRKYRKSEPTDQKYKNAPTFREFIDYMLDLPLHRLDSHWLPTYFQCMPCHIKYSILGRIDTMPEDSKEILSRIGVEKQLPFAHVTRGKTSDQTVEQYYAELDRATLDRLYQLYEMDFLLFDFTPDSFYNYVQPNNSSDAKL